MAGKAGTLAVYLTANNTGLKKGAKEATGIMKGLGGQIKTLAATAGVAFSASAMVSYTKQLVNSLNEVKDGSERLGISIQAYQELSYAARYTAVSMGEVEMATNRATKAVERAVQGDQRLNTVLQSINLSWRDLIGLAPDKQLEKIGAALVRVEDSAKRNTYAMEIFGQSGTKMMPLLSGLRDLRQEAHDLGRIISDETVRKAAELNDAFGRLGDGIAAMIAKSGLVEWLHDAAAGAEALANGATDPASYGLRSEYVDENGIYRERAYSTAADARSGLRQAGYQNTALDKQSYAQYMAEEALKAAGATRTKSNGIVRWEGLDRDELYRISGEAINQANAEWDSWHTLGEGTSFLHQIQLYIDEFTTTVEDVDQAIAELEAGAAKRIGRALNTTEMEALQPKIDEMRMQFKLAKELRDGDLEGLLIAQQAETDLLDLRLNGTQQEIELQKALNKIKEKGIELTTEETAKVMAQVVARSQLQQTADFRKYLTGQAGNLRQTMLSSLGYDLQASVEGALRQAAQAAGGMLTAEQSNTVTRLAELEYRMTQQPALRMLGSEIQTNDLTRRGGFATGAVMPDIKNLNQRILDVQIETNTAVEEMNRILAEIAG